MGNAPCPWIIMDRTGGTTECATELRREGLERMLAANAGAFRALAEGGALDAVLDVTGAAAAADARLSRLNSSRELAA